ncbi:MAG: NAD(P)H-hydrate dehydratase, partial [Planctomycetales bacterium]|nr:NAD(P)H-hydrate dehydratase [Planctomycetales bacterium]
AAFSPCYMTLPQPHDCCGRISELSEVLLATLTHASCVAIGPGLGRSTELQHLIRQILDAVPCPVVIDADGLNNVADGKIDLPRRGGLVLTPHPGEWTRLSSIPALARQEQIDTSAQFALEHRATIVLKGHSTFVTDGMTGAFVQTGTPAMATGGSGDVLTGVIAALICQGLAPRDAAHLAVHIHGLAGQIAQRDQASHVVLPTELISYLPHALRDAIENSVPRSDSK